MKNLLRMVLVGAGIYLVWLYVKESGWKRAGQPKFKGHLPTGAKTTGKVAFSQTGAPPSHEGDVLGYDPKLFAEVRGPEGDKSWVEMERIS